MLVVDQRGGEWSLKNMSLVKFLSDFTGLMVSSFKQLCDSRGVSTFSTAKKALNSQSLISFGFYK